MGRPRRWPLSDVTNVPPSTSAAAFSVLRPTPASGPKPFSSDLGRAYAQCSSSIGSSATEKPRGPRIDAASAARPVNSVISGHSKVNKRGVERGNKKGKSVAKREDARRRIAELESALHESTTRWKAMGVHKQTLEATMENLQFEQGCNQLSTEVEDEDALQSMLPQDYIEKQRAYFQEIDAFKLDVEVVSDSEVD